MCDIIFEKAIGGKENRTSVYAEAAFRRPKGLQLY